MGRNDPQTKLWCLLAENIQEGTRKILNDVNTFIVLSNAVLHFSPFKTPTTVAVYEGMTMGSNRTQFQDHQHRY